jgi:hypothetical protein
LKIGKLPPSIPDASDNDDHAEANRHVAVTIGEDKVRRNVTYQVRDKERD